MITNITIDSDNHNQFGNKRTMGQPVNIENKAQDSLSPSIIKAGQLKNEVQTSTNVEYFDNSNGSTNNVITGQTAQIKFTRGDDLTKSFFLQKRAGGTNPKDNVLETFATKPTTGALNAIFSGIDGIKKNSNVSINAIYANIDSSKAFNIRNGAIQAVMSTDGVVPTSPHFYVTDARNFWNNASKSGVVVAIQGSGTYGISGLGYANNVVAYVDSAGFHVEGPVDIVTGATGTFTTVDSKTVTVTKGIITSIV